MEATDKQERRKVYNSLNGWMMPLALPKSKSKTLPFDEQFLPETLRPWAVDVAERMQVPLDYPGIAMLVMAGAVIGRRIGIRPKQHDDWTVVPNLWGLVIGRPGVLKSPALKEILRPINRLEAQAAEKYQQAWSEYEILSQVNEAKASDMRKRLKESSGSLIDAEVILQDYIIEPPLWQRFVVNDPTPEKLAEILKVNQDGVLLFRDEMAGWFSSLRKAGQEGARKFFLESWNGTGGYTVDRIGRGTIHVPQLCLSMLGSIQPAVLEAMIRSGLTGGEDDDGLLQRFQLMIWPDLDPNFENIDRPPNHSAKKSVFDVIEKLVSLDALSIGALPDDDERRNVPFLRFDEYGQDSFNHWREELERRVRGGLEHPAFESHLAKYRSLLPSIVLIYHVAEGKTGPIGGETLNRAQFFLDYLESHARRIFAPVIAKEEEALHALARHLMKGDLSDLFTIRDVYRKGWSGLKDKYVVEQAIVTLINLKWLEEESELKNGRPTTRYRINPNLYL